jgi:hypothetical protein
MQPQVQEYWPARAADRRLDQRMNIMRSTSNFWTGVIFPVMLSTRSNEFIPE